MNNVTMTVKGNKLTIEVDLSQDHGPSKSGKTVQIASTLGNKAVPAHDDMRIGLNVYKYADGGK